MPAVYTIKAMFLNMREKKISDHLYSFSWSLIAERIPGMSVKQKIFAKKIKKQRKIQQEEEKQNVSMAMLSVKPSNYPEWKQMCEHNNR